ncbi:MAG: phosphatase PAP2 family protein [Nocardioidaceae bacterium]
MDDDWTTEVSSGFALAGFLFVVFIGFTLLAMGPLRSIDAYFNVQTPPPAILPFLHVLDRIGQRAICVPILLFITWRVCRRLESWRPAVVVLISVFMLNLIVLILKVGLGRAEPRSADPSFFQGGMAYPSGHSSNIVLVYGLAVYVLSHYHFVSRRTMALLCSGVVLLSVTMVVTSLIENWHWFADLLAGLIIGAVVLQLTVAVDAMVPEDTGFEHGWRVGVRTVLASLRRHRPPTPPTSPSAAPAAIPSTAPPPPVTRRE